MATKVFPINTSDGSDPLQFPYTDDTTFGDLKKFIAEKMNIDPKMIAINNGLNRLNLKDEDKIGKYLDDKNSALNLLIKAN